MYPKCNIFSQTLTAQAVTLNGAAFACDPFDDLILAQQMTAVTGTTPTLDTKLQMSIDSGTTWIDVTSATLAQLTAVGANMKQFVGPVPRLCRVVMTIGGTTPAFTGTVVVEASIKGSGN